MKIAITGKGGVGKTTLAGTLARLLAQEGEDVVAIDADPDMNLASALGLKENPTPISKLEDLIAERAGEPGGIFKLNPKVNDILEKYGVKNEDGVRLLTMGTIELGGSGCVCPASAFLRALLRHIIFKERVVILDMEAGIEHLGRGTTRNVDLMIVVVEPGMRSVETLSRIRKLAADIGVVNVAVVINKDIGGDDMVREKIEEMGVPILGSIPYDVSFVRADLEGKSPLDAGGEAIDAIKGIKDKLLEMFG
ncbi:MAG TPA: cobalamin biosynthesis protein CobN [Candidatus Syntrophoarchaeum butanivorans]|uniref:Cobalamin biosynthesis protein CobN n=1 Tax=Candidatus Syntropharchaeum butanivorans TaxID=1839936 RepID=A0A7C1B5Z5_9EURY|nr:MAG: cobalamin biosynthesis protein CobN [Candidatus Syntrophoarchaeum sp. WYZ-LMO15]HDM36452.1 cobalamin biosynthesis protein CobN [Candidatus Syntrophoarchaeum butanivorans]